MKSTLIITEDYLRNEMSKIYQPHTMNRSNYMADHRTEVNKHEQYKDNKTNKSDRTKSTLASERQTQQLPRSTGYIGNSSLKQNDSKTNKIGQNTQTVSKH